jgi:hypothetical protein
MKVWKKLQKLKSPFPPVPECEPNGNLRIEICIVDDTDIGLVFDKSAKDIILNLEAARNLANSILVIANTIDANLVASKTTH